VLDSGSARAGRLSRLGALILPEMRSGSRKDGATFVLRPAPPLDFALTLERYRRWGPDPANVYDGAAFYRVARVAAGLVPFRLEASDGRAQPALRVTFRGPDTPETRAHLSAEVGRLLGLGSDLPGFYARAAQDPVLAPLVTRLHGLRPTVAPEPFEMLVGAITAQQVSLTFAFTVRARLVREFGEARALDGVTVYAFPVPEVLAAQDVTRLRAVQLTTRKAEYIVGLAGAVADGRLDLAALAAAPDDEVIARLTAVRGLGRWTAEWFLARALGRPDVCPADDLGVRRAFERWCFRGRPADPAQVRRFARRWQPYRSLAVHYLLAGMRADRAAVGAARGA
jgi:DNA-3-methyladenine glycosylase II